MKKTSKNKTNVQNRRSTKLLIIVAVLIGAVAVFAAFNNGKSKPADEISQGRNAAPVVRGGDLIINAGDVSDTAKFYPYQAGDIYMEVMAVKASDGSVRTAFNTCQVCYDSGQGYYRQAGNEMICQNCGNVFSVDDIEKVKGGCNPVPIMSGNKKIDGDNIAISEQFLNENKEFFADWKRD